MANTIHVDIVSAEGEIFAGEARMVFLPGLRGRDRRHAAARAAADAAQARRGARAGRPRARSSPSTSAAARSRCSRPRSRCSPTRRRAPSDLDEAAALAARQRAEEALAGKIDKIEQAEALAELARAIAQLKLIERLRKLRG